MSQAKHSGHPQLPLADRDLAACRRCHKILTMTQFTREGCSTCGDGPLTRAEATHHTTSQFYGHVGIVDGRRSWIARLIGCGGAPSAVYAAKLAKPAEDDERALDAD